MTFIVGDLLGIRAGEGRCRVARPIGRRRAPGDSSTGRGSWPPRARGSVSGSLQVQMLPPSSDLPQPRPLNRRRLPGRGRGTGIVSHMRSRARFAVLTAVFVLAFQFFTFPATAATCLFVPPTVTVDVGGGETATIGRTGDDITLDGAACGGATVANTDTIAITTTGVPIEAVIDLTGGPLAPGLTPEADGSEIEITINLPTGTPTLRILGSSGVDRIVAGASGINLNSDETTADADVTITGTPVVVIDGRDGDDVISLGG